MNQRQKAALQTITNKKWIEWKAGHSYEGEMSFTATQIGDKIFLHGSNNDTTQWFQKMVIVQAVVGVKGGINQFKFKTI